MLKKILKWTMITTGGIITIAIMFYIIIYFITEARINKVYSVKLQTLAIPNDTASYVRGKHIAENRGCLGCHGSNLANGEVFLDERSPLGVLYASNITSGKGGINFSDKDWIRVLRHGLNQQNKSIWFMPSHEVSHLSNQELAELICFLKQQPPVDEKVPDKSIKPLGRVLTYFDQFPLLPAEMINHDAVYPDRMEAAVTPEYGKYLATTCTGCHGANFKGGPAHGKTEPAIPDITSTGNLGKWKNDAFLTALRREKHLKESNFRTRCHGKLLPILITN